MTKLIAYEYLNKNDAINLWLEGKDDWNDWVEKNPKKFVGFSGVEFNKIDTNKEDFNGYSDAILNHNIWFSGFKFPNGGVSFKDAIFGGCTVDFNNTDFGDGRVDFRDATFGGGTVSFYNATFGHGRVLFERVTFGDGTVFFTRATFRDCYVSFDQAKFGDGGVGFIRATFGNGFVYFGGATFGNGDIVFERATFGDGTVSFTGAIFGEGDVVFHHAKCDGLFDFRPKETEKIKRLSFFACTFKGVMLLEGKFSCTPDLRSTYLATNLDLENLTIEYKRLTEKELRQDAIKAAKKQWMKNKLEEWENGLPEKPTDDKKEKEKERQEFQKKLDNELTSQIIKYWIEKGINPKPENSEFELVKEIRKTAVKGFDFLVFRQDKETPAYFRRLKELAEKNRDHNKALDFFAEECSADRENQNKARAWLDKAYANSCSHGRSIKRPLGWLAGSWLFFSVIYCSIILLTNKFVISSFLCRFCEVLSAYAKSLLFCIFNSVPFLGFTRHGYNNIFCKFFGSEPSFWVYIPIGLQSLIAFILLFLIGLGIRNRFRI